MDAASEGLAQEEDGEEGINEQDIFYRVILFLAAITGVSHLLHTR